MSGNPTSQTNGKKPKLVVILGPTASGKSALAVDLALRFNGEVISADSRQVYRGMDIGTGKITEEETRGIPHHLLSIASPHKQFSVTEYQRLGKAVLDAIIARNNLPIICGGTAFYIKALVDGMVLPEVSPNVALRASLATATISQLSAMLETLDPTRHSTIDTANPARLVRAIEIATAIGTVPPLTTVHKYTPLFIGIQVDQEGLVSSIQTRLNTRINGGMIEEAEQLHQSGLSYERMEDLGLEYRFLARYLQGKIGKDALVTEIQKASEQYAKRQLTWWKHDSRINWVSRGNTIQATNLVSQFLWLK